MAADSYYRLLDAFEESKRAGGAYSQLGLPWEGDFLRGQYLEACAQLSRCIALARQEPPSHRENGRRYHAGAVEYPLLPAARDARERVYDGKAFRLP